MARVGYARAMNTIFLVRHAETDYNLDKRLCSRTDAPLNDAGREQALALGKRLKGSNFGRVITSPAARCQETADLIIKGAHGPDAGASITVDPRLREADFGRFEGESATELEAGSDPLFEQWRQGGVLSPEDGVEPLISVAARAGSFLDDLPRDPLPILVVSHGYLLRLMLAQAVLGLPVRGYLQVWLDNGTFSAIRREGDRWQVRALNA